MFLFYWVKYLHYKYVKKNYAPTFELYLVWNEVKVRNIVLFWALILSVGLVILLTYLGGKLFEYLFFLFQ